MSPLPDQPSIAQDVVARRPLPAELARVLHLFRRLRVRRDAQFLVAERRQPVARFVAAAAWSQEDRLGRFQVVCAPGVKPEDALPPLLPALELAGNDAGLEAFHYADALPENHALLATLEAGGYERVRSERVFETDASPTWHRISRLYQKHCPDIPPAWHTEPIRLHPPEAILGLIAPHRLLQAEDVRHAWTPGAAAGFDLELSCVLLDGRRPFGALLGRCVGTLLFVEVQVIVEPNPRLRSLADLCMVHHLTSRVGPDGPLHKVCFRCGEKEHRQTANLALRMGGREVGRLLVLGKRLAV